MRVEKEELWNCCMTFLVLTALLMPMIWPNQCACFIASGFGFMAFLSYRK